MAARFSRRAGGAAGAGVGGQEWDGRGGAGKAYGCLFDCLGGVGGEAGEGCCVDGAETVNRGGEGVVDVRMV